MVEKVPSPFNSPLVKVMLAVFWLVYLGVIVATLVRFVLDRQSVPLDVIAIAWTFILPWITWNFLSGVQLERGKRVGGGPMYTRVELHSDEDILFNAPTMSSSNGSHLFVTNERLILLAFRLFGRAQAISLRDISSVEPHEGGLGWPYPRESILIRFDHRKVLIRPWAAPPVMGGIPAAEFHRELLRALGQAGVPASAFASPA